MNNIAIFTDHTLQNDVVKYLDARGMKKGFLAAHLGISAPYLSQWLHGKVDLSNARLAAIREFISK